jgi:single-strand DNA-binding protein
VRLKPANGRTRTVNDKYTTEVVLRAYRGELTLLDSRGGGQGGGGYSAAAVRITTPPRHLQVAAPKKRPAPVDELEDEIPF